MRIARLIGEFSKENKGGLSPNALYLSKHQIDQGHEVKLYTFTDKQDYSENFEGVQINYIKKPKAVRTFGGPKIIKKIQTDFEPDIVHSISCMPLGWQFPLYKNKLDSKYVLSIHGTTKPLQNSINKDLSSKKDSFEYGNLMRMLAKHTDLVLPVAQFIKDELLTSGMDADKIEVIPTGMDFELFSKKHSAKNEIFTVLYVGRFAQQKGLPFLLKAMDQLKGENIKLKIIGGVAEDNDYDNVITLIKELKLQDKVEILDPVPYKDLPSVYRAADVFVLPSIMEPRAKAINEAMAAGVPVIATNQGGVPETVIDGETGILVAPENSSEIAKKILQIKNNKKLREELIKNGRYAAEQFDWKKIAIRYSKEFKKLI